MANIRGHEFKLDGEDRVRLTDIYKKSGAKKSRDPYSYRISKRGAKMMAVANWLTKQGCKGGTWAAMVVAIDYADYVGLIQTAEDWAADLAKMKAERQRQANERARQYDEERRERGRQHREWLDEMDELQRDINEKTRSILESLDRLEEEQVEGDEWKRGTIYDPNSDDYESMFN